MSRPPATAVMWMEKDRTEGPPLFLDRNVQPIQPEEKPIRLSHNRSRSMICFVETSWFHGAVVERPCAPGSFVEKAGVIHERTRQGGSR